MTWKVEFTTQADRDFAKLTPEARRRIDKVILGKLLVNPDLYLIPLVGDLDGLYKFRVGDYRLICAKEGRRLVITIIKIGHRREVYH